MSIRCDVISFGSQRYEETVAIRNQLLREPLGLIFSDEEKADEPRSIHLAACEDRHIVACVVLTPLPESAGLLRLRQCVVVEDRQGQGVGRMLCQFAEDLARERGFKRITMHARLSAAGFYERLAYQPVGEAYEEIGIAHVTMEKQL